MTELTDCMMSNREINALLSLAEHRKVLELGCWRGYLTAQLIEVATSVWTVDHHLGDQHTGPVDTLADYFATLGEWRRTGRLVSIVGDLAVVLPGLPERWFDLVVVDAAHDFESVHRDVAAALTIARWGGHVALHDWGKWDVMDAASHLLAAPESVVDCLAIFKVRG